jgi:hypothetical protein
MKTTLFLALITIYSSAFCADGDPGPSRFLAGSGGAPKLPGEEKPEIVEPTRAPFTFACQANATDEDRERIDRRIAEIIEISDVNSQEQALLLLTSALIQRDKKEALELFKRFKEEYTPRSIKALITYNTEQKTVKIECTLSERFPLGCCAPTKRTYIPATRTCCGEIPAQKIDKCCPCKPNEYFDGCRFDPRLKAVSLGTKEELNGQGRQWGPLYPFHITDELEQDRMYRDAAHKCRKENIPNFLNIHCMIASILEQNPGTAQNDWTTFANHRPPLDVSITSTPTRTTFILKTPEPELQLKHPLHLHLLRERAAQAVGVDQVRV